MRKQTTVLWVLLLLWIGGVAPTAVANKTTSPIINETLFVHILRDIELLNSWLSNKNLSKEAVDILHTQYYQEILYLYKADQQSFDESVAFYLTSSLEKAIQVYEQTYTALEDLL